MIPDTVFSPVAVNGLAITPVVIVLVAALLGVLVEAFVPRRIRHTVQVALAVLALLGAFLVLALNMTRVVGPTLGGSLIFDGPGTALQLLLLLMGMISVIILSERFKGRLADAFTPSGASVVGVVILICRLPSSAPTTSECGRG